MGPHLADANLSALIESTEDLIWSVDLNYRLLTFNRAFHDNIQRNFGVLSAVGMRPGDVLPPARAALWPPLYDRALSEGPFRMEYSLVDGRTLEMAFNRIVQDGETTGISVFGKDITERKTAAKALLDAEKQYRDMFDGALEGIYRTSLEGKSLAANSALAKMLGYESAREFVATFADSAQQMWLDPNDRLRVLHLLEQHGVVREYECQLKRKDGTAIWVSFNSRKVCGEDGRPFYTEGFIEDITERKRIEDALRRSEEEYRDMFEGALEGIYRTSLEGKPLAANAAVARMLGYHSAQEFISTIANTAHEVWLDPDARSPYLRLLEQHGVLRGYECQFKRKDGTAIWVSLNSRTVFGEDGQPLYTEGFIEDITERKRIEDALRKSEEKFARAFRGSPAAMLLASVESEGNRIVDANEAFERLSGYRREEVIGRTAQQELRLWADPREYDEYLKQFRGGGRIRSFEFHFRRKTGEIGTGLISAESMELDGQLWVISTTIDITERKAAERGRQQSEQQYRSLFNSMQEGVALHKLICSGGAPDNYVLLDVNRRFEELLGMQHEHVVNRLATEVYGTPTAPYLQEYASVVEEGKPLEFETYFPPLDKHFVISVTPMGEDLFATIFFDVTEVRRTEERYRLISENAADVIWMWDLEEDRCVYVSPSAQQLRGFTPEEILAQPMDQAMPEDTYRMAVSEIQSRRAAVESGDESARIKTYEVGLLCKDGTTVATETVTKLVSDTRGKVRYAIGASRDITELKRAEAAKARIEDELRQAQKLESVGRLAAGVAHDFNNLLTVINGYSRLLLGSLQADDPLRGGLEEIHKAGERAAALTQQLLAFSRKQILQPRVLDLNRVVDAMRPMLERLMGENVELCVKLHAQPTTICADPHQLEQALMNLAANSRDAMPGGGRFSIETGFVKWGESQVQLRPGAHVGPYVVLAVSDTGEGMSEETRGHIFEPFFTTKEVGKGTGLGLSTIHGIVEQSGGYVEAASELGRGTTFKIYMPSVVDTPADSPKAEAIPAIEGHQTVLVVEDQPEVRRYAAAALEAYGYHVMKAASAEEALILCERAAERIDLILTDVVMPGLSGREMADQLKQRGRRVKVLFMSGYTDDTIVLEGVPRKEAEFIQKPFGPDELAGKVREMLMAPDRAARILVADDESGVRGFLRLVLESGGYEVMEAAHGNDVLKEARAGRVDLVVTDLVMPEQEGIETIQLLRKDPALADIGIIAISGALGGKFPEVARKLGAQVLLSKPVDAELLLVKVAEVLKSRNSSEAT